MVGRDQTVREISGRLITDRLVTIVGPGGIGKTTVAVSIGHEMLPKFAGGVQFIDLGAIGDSGLVLGTVASTLGLRLQSNNPASDLIRFLRDKRMLLIFDSCEHVIEAVAALAEGIFTDTTSVCILATSRESLRIEGEHVHRLQPLSHPPEGANLSAAQALGFPSVQLFVERVAAGGGGFDLNDDDAPIVGEICRKLDGIALAIELAAGRVHAYGIRETMALLNDRFRLLWEGRRTALPRHQTLNATLDWSYGLLPESERIVLNRLSVFIGAFGVPAVRAVVVDEGISDTTMISAIASLLEKSLMTTATSGSMTRYRLLDTTRAYVSGKLADGGEFDLIMRRHAIYYRVQFERTEMNSLASIEDNGLRSELLGNARAALEWAFSSRDDVGIGTALAAVAAPFLSELSLLTECRRLTKRALEALAGVDRGTRRELELQASLGTSIMLTEGNREEARNALTRALEIAEAFHDAHFQMRLLRGLHNYHIGIGDFSKAAEMAHLNEAVARRSEDPAAIAMADWMLGMSNYFTGNQLAAEANCAALLAYPSVSRASATYFGFDSYARTRVRCAYAAIRWFRGFADQAARMAQETIEEQATVEHPATFATCLIFSGFMFLRIGNSIMGAGVIERLIAHADKHSLGPTRAVGLGMKGSLAIQNGDVKAGVELLRHAIDAMRAERHALHLPTFLGTLAEGLARTEQSDAAMLAVDEGISQIERNGQALNLPELLRIKGTVLMERPKADLSAAEELFLSSLDLARRQHALAWELRAATGLAQLRLKQGQPNSAFEELSPVYARFSEGFGSRDLKAARALLDRLTIVDNGPH